ncbi:probable WRKY transcription factor 62 [Sorghum bicolor]|nr:probable WRKY transcription factor 62 [Sorghum bicolor]|eukprot:XP_002441803.2 probable WRKY transcription factor 62 [Sorghum bicolor]
MKLTEMKHHHYLHDNRCLPQSSASDHHSLACDCDHRSAMKEISREQSLVTQLRAIVLPALQQADERYELVAQMFQSILDCSSKAMAELQRHHQSDDGARARPDDVLVDDKKRVKRSISDDCISKEEDVVKPRHKQLKRGRFDESMSLETPVPHYDGRQWRKYGQKHINKSKHPRNYYRCAYRQEQGCKATKTVQQQDDSTGTDHPVMFTVVYHDQHTCKDNNGINLGIDDSETNSQSSISTISTDPYGRETPSLDGNKLLDKSADLITRNSMYEPADMTVFEPLDLDSWALDAFLRFGA